MKTRIKVVYHYGQFSYWPQYRMLGIWFNFSKSPNHSHYDAQEYIDYKLMVREKGYNKKKVSYFDYPIPTPEPEHFQNEKPKLDKDGLLVQSIPQPTTSSRGGIWKRM